MKHFTLFQTKPFEYGLWACGKLRYPVRLLLLLLVMPHFILAFMKFSDAVIYVVMSKTDPEFISLCLVQLELITACHL